MLSMAITITYFLLWPAVEISKQYDILLSVVRM